MALFVKNDMIAVGAVMNNATEEWAMGSRLKKVHGVITVEEAKRAIYVDFEGLKDQSPCIVGILVDGLVEQVVLDSRLASAAAARGCRLSSIQEVASAMRDRCQSQKRVLVAYSQHERRVFLEHTGIDFHDVYRDARMIVTKWWNVVNYEKKLPNRKMKTYLKAIGSPMPATLGVGNAAARLRAVIDMLGRRERYGALTPAARRKWKHLLAYNAYDCHGMQSLVTHAVSQLGALDAGQQA